MGRNTCGRLPVGVSRSAGTMSDAHNVQRCDFCKSGHVTGRNEGISFRQRTDVFCRAEIPSRFVTAAGQSIGIKTQRRSSTRSFVENTTSFVSTRICNEGGE
jgi:hypothetical protein